jgi:hypothetical protein
MLVQELLVAKRDLRLSKEIKKLAKHDGPEHPELHVASKLLLRTQPRRAEQRRGRGNSFLDAVLELHAGVAAIAERFVVRSSAAA